VHRQFLGGLTWHTSFIDVRSRPRRVFLFSGGFLSNWGIVVLTNRKHRLIQWKGVHVGGRLKSAAVNQTSGTVELSVVADTDGVHFPDEARGTYRFLLDDSGITSYPVEWDEAYGKSLEQQVVKRLRADEVSHGDSKPKTETP
jgi:hypothetical protein